MGIDVLLVLRLVDRDVDHVPLLLFELALVAGRGLGDLAHREARLYGLDHAAHLVYLPEILVSLPLQLVRQRLDEVRPPERVYGVRYPRLQGGYLLGSYGDPDRLLRRQRERLVEGVGVRGRGA